MNVSEPRHLYQQLAADLNLKLRIETGVCQVGEKLPAKRFIAEVRKDPPSAKLAIWQHPENTRQMFFNASSNDFEFNVDNYLFTDNPVVHLNASENRQK